MNEYFDLLKEWCDRLLSLQVTEFQEKEFYGGIMCPSCGRIHGRCADAIYPMMTMADITKDEKYVTCAKRLFRWSDNLYRKEGCYYNDTNSDWRGITVFFVIQLGEALLEHGHLLDRVTADAWRERLNRTADYLADHIDEIGGNINYPVTCAHAMAVAYQVLGDPRYRSKAGELSHKALDCFTEDGLLYGEGKKRDELSPKGCRPVDLGYNVEESLPGLLSCAVMIGEKEVELAAERAMKIHLEFMLPDGAWDNSWGTRNNKWSYWGSRTSDGCQPGYGLLAKKSPEFAEAVRRNTRLLKACTHDGLLHGGPMFNSAKEPPCVHHTFCHAKALAALLDLGWAEETIETGTESLPSDRRCGVTEFPSVHVRLIGKGPWRATISDYDVEYSEEGHATGGAVTLLWHERLGPVFTGTMGRYSLVEPNNMQIPRNTVPLCLTPRLEYQEHGIIYRNINDKAAEVICVEEKDEIVIVTRGTMTDSGQQGDSRFEIRIRITDGAFTMEPWCEREAILYLPLVSRSGERVETAADGDGVDICRGQGSRLKVRASGPLTVSQDRLFNPVGGMEAVLCQMKVDTEVSYHGIIISESLERRMR